MRIALSILLQLEASGENHQPVSQAKKWSATVPATTKKNITTTNATLFILTASLIKILIKY
jgi:hypothetical protein